MNSLTKKILIIIGVSCSFLLCSVSNAYPTVTPHTPHQVPGYIPGGNVHQPRAPYPQAQVHPRARHHHYRRPYYRGRGYYYRGPEIIISGPVERYFSPRCDDMEVCDNYGRCWLEEYCE